MAESFNNLFYEINDNENQKNITIIIPKTDINDVKYTIPEYINNIPVLKLRIESIEIINSLSFSDNLIEVNLPEECPEILINHLHYYGNSNDFYSEDENNPVYILKNKSQNFYTPINSYGVKEPLDNISSSCGTIKNILQGIWGKKHPIYQDPSISELALAMSEDLTSIMTATGTIKPTNRMIYREVTQDWVETFIIGSYNNVEDKNIVKGGYFSVTDFIIELRIPTLKDINNNIIDNQCSLGLSINNENVLCNYIPLANSQASSQVNKANYIVLYGNLIGQQIFIQSGGFSTNGEYDQSYTLKNYTNSNSKAYTANAIKQFKLYLTHSNDERTVFFPQGTFIRVWGKTGIYE